MSHERLNAALREVSLDRLLRICWPTPDAVCLQGGCLRCADAPVNHSIGQVVKYAKAQHFSDDFAYGLSEGRWSHGLGADDGADE